MTKWWLCWDQKPTFFKVLLAKTQGHHSYSSLEKGTFVYDKNGTMYSDASVSGDGKNNTTSLFFVVTILLVPWEWLKRLLISEGEKINQSLEGRLLTILHHVLTQFSCVAAVVHWDCHLDLIPCKLNVKEQSAVMVSISTLNYFDMVLWYWNENKNIV